MSTGWSLYVIALVALNIVGCAVLLLFTGRKEPGERPEGETTGHTWDDGTLAEYNNPLPRWWLGLFVITILFAIGYLVLYPGLGSYGGTLGWTERTQYAAEVAQAEAREARSFAAFAGKDVAQLARDPAALAVGARLFAINCSACHGSDARGAPGFPNLADDDWLWGGDAATIETTIAGGRQGAMPSWRASLGDQGVAELAAYVYGLNGRPLEPALASLATRGAERFATTCAACHGPQGKGTQALGAPNLTDSVWLYGGDFATLERTIGEGRGGRMPAHGALLGPQRVKLLAAYVYSLRDRRAD